METPKGRVVTLHQVQDTLEKLSRYPSGWNGLRSNAADHQSFALARQFVAMLWQANPKIAIEPTIFSVGHAAIEMYQPVEDGQNRWLIEFLPDGQLAVNLDTPVQSLDFDIQFNGLEIPEQLTAYIIG